MLRRTLILLPLLLCLALWLCSFVHPLSYVHTGLVWLWEINLYHGGFYFAGNEIHDRTPLSDRSFDQSFLGFRLGGSHSRFFGWYDFVVGIPLWFPTVLTAALDLLLWRKSKRKSPSAFPIEPTPTTATVRERQQNSRIL